MTFYAVKKGLKTGIFETWADIKPLVTGYFGAKYRKFETFEEAKAFLGDDVIKNAEIRCSNDESVTPHTKDDGDLVVFCDGACSGNGKICAKAGYSVVWPFHEEYNNGWRLEGDQPKTNNRAELMGVIKSFEVSEVIDPSKTQKLIIYTDSMLIVNSVNSWIKGWERKNWKKTDGSPVLNQDLLKQIIAYQKTRRSDVRHVRAHTGRTDFWSIYNDKADALAKATI